MRKNGEGILCHLLGHKGSQDKDYWTEAVVYTTSNNSFVPTEISYLEHRFCAMAIMANRYVVKNANELSSGHITEEKKSELEEFIDYAKIAMGTLGHNLFEPYITHDQQNNEEPILYSSKVGIDSKRNEQEKDLLYSKVAKLVHIL